jgi:hypothetical protein
MLVGNEWEQAGYTDLIGSRSPLLLELVGRFELVRSTPTARCFKEILAGNAAPVCRLPCVGRWILPYFSFFGGGARRTDNGGTLPELSFAS